MAQLNFNDQIGRFIEVPSIIKEKSTGNKVKSNRVVSIWESPLEKDFNVSERFRKIINPSSLSSQFYEITFVDGATSTHPVDDLELIYIVGDQNA